MCRLVTPAGGLPCSFPVMRPSINIVSERPGNLPGNVVYRGKAVAVQESRNGRGDTPLSLSPSLSFSRSPACSHKQDRLENFPRPGTAFVSKDISIAFATLQFTALSAR